MDEESLQALNALSEELSLLKEELREARSGGGEGFLSKASELSASLDALSRRLGEMEESRISELSSLRADAQSVRGDIGKIGYSADSVFSAKLAGLEEKLAALDKAVSSVSASSGLQVSETSDFKSELSSLRESVSSLREETKAAAENSYAIAEKLDGMHSSAKSSVTADVASLCMEIKGLSSSLTAHAHGIAKLSAKIESVDAATQKLPALLESYNSNSAAIQDIEAKLSSVLSALSTQEHELSNESSKAKQFEELALSLQNELSVFSREMEANSRALESMNASMALLKQRDDKTVQQLEPTLDSISQSLTLANEALSSVSSQLSGASSIIKGLDATSYSLSREASRMQAAYSALQEKMSKAAGGKQDLSSIGFQLEQLTAEVRQLQKMQELPSGKGDYATDLSKAFVPMLKELHAISNQVHLAQQPAQLDFAPILQRLDEIKSVQSTVSDEAFQKPVLQKAVFEELQAELRQFDKFDLSDRAKLVVGRLNSLAAKGIELAD